MGQIGATYFNSYKNLSLKALNFMKQLIKFLIIASIFVGLGFYGGTYWLGQKIAAGGGRPPHGMGGPPGGAQNNAMPPMPVDVMIAANTKTQDNLDIIGTLLAQNQVMIKPEIAAKIVALPLVEGTSVKAGDVLVQLDPTLYKADVAEINARRALTALNLKRAQTLAARGFGPQEKVDELRAQSTLQQAQSARAAEMLRKTTIRAPFAGVVGLRHVSLGDYVQPAQSLVSLQSVDPLRLEFAVPERFAAMLPVGKSINVLIDSLGGAPLKAKITAKDGQIDTQSRNLMVRAEIANKDGLLKPGGFARVQIDLNNAGSNSQAIAVPEAAIVPNGEQPQVYVVVDGKVVVKPVHIQSRQPDGAVLINEGLSVGDMVITGGHLKIGPGAPVMPLNTGK